MFTYNLIDCNQFLLPSKILSEEHKTSDVGEIAIENRPMTSQQFSYYSFKWLYSTLQFS